MIAYGSGKPYATYDMGAGCPICKNSGRQGGCFASALKFFFNFIPPSSSSVLRARVREYNALYRLEWPSDLHYSSRRLEASDTPLKFSPGAKKRGKRASERARMIDLVHDKYFYVFPAT